MTTSSPALNRANEHRRSGQPTEVGVQRRIWIVSDDLSGPPDEGVKNFTWELFRFLRLEHDVEVISTSGAGEVPQARWLPTSRTFLSRSLRAALRSGKPEVIVYATRRSATFFSVMRARLLKLYYPSAQVVLLGLQTRMHARWQKPLVRRLRPDLILVQSHENHDYLARMGCDAVIVPSGVDVERFQPVDEQRKVALRKQYGLDPDRPVVLHVGHLQAGRGIRDLIPLAATRRCQVVVVASSSTPQEQQLAAELQASGIRLITDFLPHIEELYQLADCYIFPVRATDNAIEAPLSVLEALACDLPVVTTRFGGLPRLFGKLGHPGIVFVDTPIELTSHALRLAERAPSGTRVLALPFSWTNIGKSLQDEILATLKPAS